MNADELQWLTGLSPADLARVRGVVRSALDRVDELLFAAVPPSALGPGVFTTATSRRPARDDDPPAEPLRLTSVGVWRIVELEADTAQLVQVRRFRVWFELPNGYRSDGRDLTDRALLELSQAAQEALAR